MLPPSKMVPDIPPDTVRAIRDLHHMDNVYLTIADQLGEILSKFSQSEIYSITGENEHVTSLLALVSGFQFAERIADDLAANFTLKRMDWKYALRLSVKHPGISGEALCHFRQKMLTSGKSMADLTQLFAGLGSLGLFPKWTMKTLEANEVLVTNCIITRMYQLNEAMKSALSLLGSFDPDWLRANAQPHWYTRYKTGRLGRPADLDDQQVKEEIGAIEMDIKHLLGRLNDTDSRDINLQVEIVDLRSLSEKRSKKSDVSILNHSGCAYCAARHPGIF